MRLNLRALFGAEKRDATLANPEPWLMRALGVTKSATGVNVSADTAMRSSAVHACVKVLAESVAMLPSNIYARQAASKGKKLAEQHPLWDVLQYQPNPEMSAFEWKETAMGHVLLRGNHYSEIVRNKAGEVIELWPLPPDRVELRRQGDRGELFYVLTGTGEAKAPGIPAERIFHLRGFSKNGIVGMSPIAEARESVGLALAAEEYGARFFGNDARPGGYLQHPQKLTREAQERLKESWEAAHSGLGNARRVAILEEGLTWQEVGIAPEEAQFLETRKFQLAEIARIYRVPLHMIQELDKATFNNIEQLSIQFVTYSLQPWLDRWQQAFMRSLLLKPERKLFFVEFDTRKLTRGDFFSRAQALHLMRLDGVVNADEWRAEEGMNPIEDDAKSGQTYLWPVNEAPAGQEPADANGDAGTEGGNDQGPAPSGQGPRPKEAGDGSDDPDAPARSDKARVERRAEAQRSSRLRLALRSSYRPVIRDAAARILRREKADVMRQAEKTLGAKRDDLNNISTFRAQLQRFYDEHRQFVEETMRSALQSYGDAVYAVAAEEVGLPTDNEPGDIRKFVEAYLGVYVLRHIGGSLGKLNKAIDAANPDPAAVLTAVGDVFDGWLDGDKRADEIAGEETVRAGDAVARATYIDGGVTRLVWRKNGSQPCRSGVCDDLNGNVVGIERNFVNQGDEVGSGSSSFTASSDIGHAPVHKDCDCTIEPD